MVECTGLENRRRATYRGFESHPLRHLHLGFRIFLLALGTGHWALVATPAAIVFASLWLVVRVRVDVECP